MVHWLISQLNAVVAVNEIRTTAHSGVFGKHLTSKFPNYNLQPHLTAAFLVSSRLEDVGGRSSLAECLVQNLEGSSIESSPMVRGRTPASSTIAFIAMKIMEWVNRADAPVWNKCSACRSQCATVCLATYKSLDTPLVDYSQLNSY